MSYAPPGVQPTILGPQVALVIDLSLPSLTSNAIDSSAVIASVKATAAEFINAQSPSATVDANALAEIVAALDGVRAVLSCTVGGAASYVGDGGPDYLQIPNSVDVAVRTIA
jgi:hypothetical protein